MSKTDPPLETWREPVSGMVFVKITGNCFMMGQNEKESKILTQDAGIGVYEKYYADELPQHRVCLDDFRIGKYEVTNKEWKKVMKRLPSKKKTGELFPVQRVSYELAMKFIGTMNMISPKNSYRLPTEAEWEFAARAGSPTAFSFGDAADTGQANYNGRYIYGLGLTGEYRGKPLPAGSFPANAFGLHDMHGNMWEWCSDWYDKTYYAQSPEKNPQGPPTGTLKVMRGGSWFVAPRSMRSANRNGAALNKDTEDFGLRLVVELGQKGGPPSDFDVDF